MIVGFGGFREGLEALAAQLAAGDLEAARATRGEDGQELPELARSSTASRTRPPPTEAARGLAERVAFAGRLDHAELVDLLPAAEAMAVTSTFPEAFGMVAAEAAACGALPVVARHSGLGEVARTLAAAVPEPARPWLTFEVGPARSRSSPRPARLARGARGPARGTREAIVEATRERYSWDGVARTVMRRRAGRPGRPPGALRGADGRARRTAPRSVRIPRRW